MKRFPTPARPQPRFADRNFGEGSRRLGSSRGGRLGGHPGQQCSLQPLGTGRTWQPDDIRCPTMRFPKTGHPVRVGRSALRSLDSNCLTRRDRPRSGINGKVPAPTGHATAGVTTHIHESAPFLRRREGRSPPRMRSRIHLLRVIPGSARALLAAAAHSSMEAVARCPTGPPCVTQVRGRHQTTFTSRASKRGEIRHAHGFAVWIRCARH